MSAHGVTGYLITKRFDHYYLCGFTGEDSAVLITKNGVHIISDGRFDTSIKREAPWAEVSLRKGTLVDEIVTVVRESGLKELAVQTDAMPVATRDLLRRKLKGVHLIGAPPIAGNMRLLKDAEELVTMMKAVRIAEAAYQAMLKSIRVGQTELEMAARLEFEMKRRGSTAPAFESIVAVDANAALPHAVPGERKVKAGCTILFDWGATYQFYRSDLTRTVFVGSIPPQMERVYEVVLAAQKKAIAAIRPGARMCDVDAVARDHIAEAGFGDKFNHGLGHGLGLDVHEPPSVRWTSQEECRPGMVVTVEPGVYLPEVGGVRIEDDVLVTPKGYQVLSRLKKDLKSAVLTVAR
jgi:Xaa-Pro aminopeptidase